MDEFREKIRENKTIIQVGNIVLCFWGAVLFCFGIAYGIKFLICFGVPMIIVSIVSGCYVCDK